MGRIMKGPLCCAKELGVYPKSHGELLKGVLSGECCDQICVLGGSPRQPHGGGSELEMGDQPGFLGIFSVVLQI